MDEEMILIVRESAKHQEIEEKVKLKIKMLQFKKAGYEMLDKFREPFVKIFMGFLAGIGEGSNEDILDRLAYLISIGKEKRQISVILNSKVKDKLRILEILAE